VGTLVVTLLIGGSAAHASVLPSGFGESNLAGGTGSPAGVAWAPDGRLFIAHKDGLVQVRKTNGSVSTLLNINGEVNSYTDRGLLGIAVDRDFATNGYLYLLYVHELDPLHPDSAAPMASRLTRVTVNGDNTLQSPGNPETVILGTQSTAPCPNPSNTVDCIPADYYWHTIGTVRSDPSDGTLWVGTGDTHPDLVDATSYRPYDPNTFAGKIIHIDRQGKGLPGHPFCPSDTNLSHVCTKVYAAGFRNPFRFTLRPGKGPAVGDVGDASYEELNLVKPGGNYGWPCYEGPDHQYLYDSETRCQQEYAKEGTTAALTPPAWYYPRPAEGSAIVAGPLYSGSNYPATYQGKLFVSDYVQGWIKTLTINGSDQVTAVSPFATNTGAVVDLEPTPAGDLTTVDIGFGSTPAVRRITYAGGNLPPNPVASASPESGPAPLAVGFTGSGSSDPEGDSLTYDWDFGDGSAHSTAANPTHTYAEAGTYTARLTVDDGFGRFPNDTVTIDASGNRAPVATITAPEDGSTYRDGQAVQLSGTGTDMDSPPPALSWQILLHHGSHLHQVGTPTGPSVSFVPLQDHDSDSHYEIVLTATDSLGRTGQDRIELDPQTISLTLASAPAAAPMIYAGLPFTAPNTRDAAVGYRATIEAPASFTYQGRDYSFSGWSDGLERKHVISVPATPTTLLASYVRAVPPETAIADGPSAITATRRPWFVFSSDDPASGYECSVDDALFQGCPDHFQTSSLADGRHSLAVRATDPFVGTPDPSPAVRSFTVDTTAPGRVGLAGSDPASPSHNNFPFVRGRAEHGSLVRVYSTRDCNGPSKSSGPASVFGSAGLRVKVPANEVTLLRAAAEDPAGNVGPCSAALRYVEDSRPPHTQITHGPAALTVDRTPAFSFRSDEAGSRFQCRRDGRGWARCAQPLRLRNLAFGLHVVRVRAIDRAGNTGPAASWRFRVGAGAARHRPPARALGWVWDPRPGVDPFP
jgi:glucose/arabinose dehydrogenase